jgi:hypothetical protein
MSAYNQTDGQDEDEGQEQPYTMEYEDEPVY